MNFTPMLEDMHRQTKMLMILAIIACCAISIGFLLQSLLTPPLTEEQLDVQKDLHSMVEKVEPEWRPIFKVIEHKKEQLFIALTADPDSGVWHLSNLYGKRLLADEDLSRLIAKVFKPDDPEYQSAWSTMRSQPN